MCNASLGTWYAPMTHCVTLTIGLSLLLLLRHVHTVETDGQCVIRATMFVTPPEQRSDQDFGLPLNIDCSATNGSLKSAAAAAAATGAFDLGAQLVAGKLHVVLNGSQTPPLDVTSYGLEYLHNCAQLQSIEIERFVGDASLTLSCAGVPLKHARMISLRNNELGTLTGHSFELLPHLKHLILEHNSLRLLETLTGCEELQELIIRRERQLALREVEVMAQLDQLERLELTQLKLIQAEVLQMLPGKLTELLVQQTPIEPHHLTISNSSDQLVNLTIVQCDLLSFTLEQSIGSKLMHLNLSGNALRQLNVMNSSLISLDLSANHLTVLNSTWFAQMSHLQVLHLQSNQLYKISLVQLLKLAPHSLIQLDLSSNQLLRLEDTERAGWDQKQPLHIQIDDNPWSCQWLLNFTHTQPQLFRLFRYAKYISQINVNGLSCKPQLEVELVEQRQQPVANSNRRQQFVNRKSHLNVSSHTVLYGNPVQQSRSQRSEALIIVFMLPLGIALLFVLLYLYLHCERLFHLSYYIDGLPCFGSSKAAHNHRFIDHIDIVRYPMPNGTSANSMAMELESQPDGYETPLSGGASICNCAGHRQSTCSRTHHVTYEAIPTELPYQLYTEIKEQADTGSPEQTPAETTIYDHLSFDEEKPLEV